MEEGHNFHSLLLGFRVKLLIVIFSAFVSIGSFYLPTQTEAAPDSNSEVSISLAKGLIMLDYESIPLPQGKSIDLHGINYLHQLNDWLSFGVGIYAPLFEGNYGGFMAVGATAHVQKKIYHDLFFDAGLSFGGGGGGSTIRQSRDLSGQGGFIKKYIGLGYDLDEYKVGMNYAHFEFLKSQINHSQLNVFIQNSVSYLIGSYFNAEKELDVNYKFPEKEESILSFELNNIFQIKPKGRKKETINSVSIQFSNMLDQKYYVFFGLEGGYKGIPLYNQFLGGLGYRFNFSQDINLYAQVGFGSGGYAPKEIDTGAGLLIYPKFSGEYIINENLGLSASVGYLFAATGSSKNYTVGAALNYRISKASQLKPSQKVMFNGYNYHIFQQTEFNARVGGEKHPNINFLGFQFDYLLNKNWYLPTQVSIAYNEFLGFPGDGEILFGIGVQSAPSDNKFHHFAQISIGPYVHGIMMKPSIGTNFSLNDKYALYARLSRVIPLIDSSPFGKKLPLKADSIGLGFTYRFSLPEKVYD